MFLWNVEKCLKIFDKVYVSSDSQEILKLASDHGAIPILRGEELCGDVPDIPVFQHAFNNMWDTDAIVAVHANNPTISIEKIEQVKKMLEVGIPEVMTCHPMSDTIEYKSRNNAVYGSIRGMTKERLNSYTDPFKPQPEALLVDTSIEIETIGDFNLCLLTQV